VEQLQPIGAVSQDITVIQDETFDAIHPNWVANQGGTLTGAAVSGGKLISTNTSDHAFYRSDITVVDAVHIIKTTVGTNPYVTQLVAKTTPAGNILMVQAVYAAGGSATAYVLPAGGGASQALFTFAQPNSPPAGTVFWLVIRVSGNRVIGECWMHDPRFGGTPFGQNSGELNTAQKLLVGAGVAGHPGLRYVGFNGTVFGATDQTLDDWVIIDPSTKRYVF